VKLIREIAQCLRRVTKAMQEEDRIPRSGALTHDGLGTFDDPTRADGKPLGHVARDPPCAYAARHRERRDDEDERDERGRHAVERCGVGGAIAGIVTRRCGDPQRRVGRSSRPKDR